MKTKISSYFEKKYWKGLREFIKLEVILCTYMDPYLKKIVTLKSFIHNSSKEINSETSTVKIIWTIWTKWKSIKISMTKILCLFKHTKEKRKRERERSAIRTEARIESSKYWK